MTRYFCSFSFFLCFSKKIHNLNLKCNLYCYFIRLVLGAGVTYRGILFSLPFIFQFSLHIAGGKFSFEKFYKYKHD